MSYILSFDIGTTGLKTIVIDEHGTILKSKNTAYCMIQEKTGQSEQNPAVWWDAVVKGIQAVLDSDIKKNLNAVGVSGQFQSLVMLDENFKPLRNAILWCDHRGDEMLQEMTEQIGKEKLLTITANPALSGSTASALLWVRKHEPQIYEKCRHIMLPHEYIRFRLTGACVTDITSASSMQLLNVPERIWSRELFDALDLDTSLVGKLCECNEIIGKTTGEAESLTGLPKGIPVAAGGGDSVVSAIGTGVIRGGSCFTSIGTSGIICTNTDEARIDRKGRVNTYCSAVPGKWSVITCSITSGFSLKWLMENFCGPEVALALQKQSDVYEEMDRIASTRPPGTGGLMFLPYLMGDRTPHLNPKARGGFFGALSCHTRADFIRAVMEGVAYSLYDGISVIRELGIDLNDFVLCGGGAKGKTWRSIIADVYGYPVTTVQNDSGSAIGAAVLAAYGSGIYSTLDEAVWRMIKRNETEPCRKENHETYMRHLDIYRELYDRLEDLFGKIE